MMQPYILGIDNVGVCVEDLGSSVSYYEKLGFEKVAENDRGVTLGLGGAKLFLFQRRTETHATERRLGLFGNPPGIDHVSFQVSDVDALHELLTTHGIEADGAPADQDWGARAFGLRDPDGNNLYFLRWL
jgi:catechol 2,3-dioxygenase-like lactoylglutathione lyase family enzyme